MENTSLRAIEILQVSCADPVDYLNRKFCVAKLNAAHLYIHMQLET